MLNCTTYVVYACMYVYMGCIIGVWGCGCVGVGVTVTLLKHKCTCSI